MRILSMTATFGKLSHETLQLQPGLNIITAPNEWGKSTWSAFILAMFYGIDSAGRSKKDALADKEHYAPWSGEPMSGRMDIIWNGRKITIERKNKGRLPFGDFAAFETESGIPVPELTAENCGQMLLGAEKSVFQRAGFLRLQDLPVTKDEALRQRLNALVTTGDESGTGENLEKKLRELKNRCHHNHTGLLPQADAERNEILDGIERIKELSTQKDRMAAEENQLTETLEKLENHRAFLAYEKNREYGQKAQNARIQLAEREEQLEKQKEACKNLPSEEMLREEYSRLQCLRERQNALEMEARMQPVMPASPRENEIFQGISGQEAVNRAKTDRAAYRELTEKKSSRHGVFWIVSAVGILTGAVLLALGQLIPGAVLLALGAACTVGAIIGAAGVRNRTESRKMQAELLRRQYGDCPPEQWEQLAEKYRVSRTAYDRELAEYEQHRSALQHKMAALGQEIGEFTGGKSIIQAAQELEESLRKYDALADALRELQQAKQVADAFSGTLEQIKLPEKTDSLTCSSEETERLLSQTRQELHRLHSRLGRLQGQMDGYPKPEQLQESLQKAEEKVQSLRQTETALLIAEKTRQLASLQLQKRFAPQISGRTQELLSRLTGGKYVRLLLDENLSLQSGSRNEDVLRSSLWRSDGTADQLYLALRLAVAEILTPDAPLVLDDALVRFDDTRLRAALEILAQEPMQVILFTCQKREENIVETL